MATAASLAGIQEYGLAWRASIPLGVPNDIPSLLDECDTAFERVKFVHNLVTRIIFILNRYRYQLPKDSLESLDGNIEQLTDSFVYDNIDSVAEWEENEILGLNEYLEEELLEQLNDLYDWADYFRVVFTK